MADATPKPVIFLAFANNHDDTIGYLRQLPDEARRLRAALERGKQDGLCEFEVRTDSTASDIFKVFQDPKFRNRIAIFHYSGHANGYQLLLESPEGKAAAADAGGLAAFLAQQQGLQLVFLNGCSTQQQTQELHDANVAVVISTSRSIDDKVATDFADLFYQGLAGGATLRKAYHEASAAIKTTKGSDLRALYFGDADKPDDHRNENGFPWNLYPREGSENADQWNLPEAVGDALFGLPALPEQDLPESPYRHLNWFRREDAEVFFGRGHQIRKLYGLLTTGTQPIILFYGQSGVGKSSLLDAGLMPRLEQSCEVRYLRRRADGLLDTLQLAFLPEASNVPIETAWLAKEEQLKKPLIVFLDQVEEFYTQPIKDLPDELDQLLRVVKATFGDPKCRPQGKLVLGFRKEWLAELESQIAAYELPRAKVSLEPLDRDGIIEVVRGPTRSARLQERYGLQVEMGLAEIIADDMLKDRGSAISTTLQILLSKMWTKAIAANSESPQFSLELYEALEREGTLLGDFFDQQLKEFESRLPRAADSGLLLDVLALHTTDLGWSKECSQERLLEEYAHVSDELPSLLRQCQDLYLLTEPASAKKERTKTTRLAHDTLAPLVRDKFDKSVYPGQRARRILDSRSADWGKGQRDAVLYGRDLIEVEHGLLGTRDLTAAEKEMVAASTNLRRKRKFQRRCVIGAAVLAVISVAMAMFSAFRSAQDSALARELSEQSNRIAEVRLLANQVSLAQRALDDNDLRRFFHYFNDCRRSRERDLLYSRLYIEPQDRFVDVNAIAISRNGDRMLTKGLEGKDLLSIHRVPIGQSFELLNSTSGFIQCATFSPKGDFIAVGGQRDKRGIIQLWSAEGREMRREIPHGSYVRQLVYSPLGDRIASVSYVGDYISDKRTDVRVFDTQTGDKLGGFLANNILSVAFSPAGNRLVVGGGDRNPMTSQSVPELSIRNVITGSRLHSLEGHRDTVFSVAWSSDGKRIISGSKDRTIVVWDVDQGELAFQLIGHSGLVRSVALSEDGETLLSSGDAAIASDDGWEIKLWDMKTRQETFSVRQEDGGIFNAQFGDGVKAIVAVLTSRQFKQMGRTYRGVRWWSPVESTGTHSFTGHSDPIRSVTFSRDGHLIASSSHGHGGGQVIVWDAEKNEERYRIPEGFVESVRFVADGRNFVTGGGLSGSIKVWDTEKGELIRMIDAIRGPVEFSPDGKAISGSSEKALKLWNVNTSNEIRSFVGPSNTILCYAFSPNGTIIASGGHDENSIGEVRIWNVDDVQKQEVRHGQGPVKAIAFTPDGKVIVSGSSDGTIALWNVTKAEKAHAIIDAKQGEVNAVCVSRTGRWIASGGKNGTIKVWDAATRQLIVTIKGHDGAVNSVTFSQDEKRLATGGDDLTIRTWAFTWPSVEGE